MHSTQGTTPARLFRASAVMCAAAGLAALAGCASTTRPAEPRTAEASAGAPAQNLYGTLRALSQRQQRTPDARARTLEPPPGVDAGAVEPFTSAETAATMPVEQALAAFASPAPQQERPAAGNQNPQAVRLYVSGRSKLLEGQAARAVTDLEAATRLDPNSPEIWRELGQAQLDLGRRTSAMVSFQRAQRLGLNDPRITVLIAREDIRARRYEEAARKITAARYSPEATATPALRQLLAIDLAEALGALGYARACRDLLVEGLSTPVASLSQSTLRSELAEVMRRRGDLWLRAGDLSCRLSEYDRAAFAYAAAAESPTLDPHALVARRVHAQLRQGRSADAALLVVEDIRQSEGRVEDRHMAVITYLARSTEVGPRLADAIAELAQHGVSSPTPTVLNRLARATAAALSGDAARAALRARSAQAPYETDLAVDLLSTYGADDARGRLRECLEAVQAHPLAADVYAGVLLNRGQAVEATLKSLEGDRSPAGRLFHAALLSRLARPDLALDRLKGEFPPAFTPAVLAFRAGAGAASGQWPVAEASERSLATMQGPDAARAHVHALKFLQQFDAALERLEALLSAPGGQVANDDLLLAAELAVRCNDARKAEGYLLRAIAYDRFDERPYEPIVSLYAPSGPLADEARLTGIARALRQNIPSSRVIRGITAQELVTRSQWEQAEPLLLSMLAEFNENGSVMNLLVTAWERAEDTHPAMTARGEQWLRSRLESRPDSTLLLTSLARVLAAQGKGEEAAALLSARLNVRPTPDVARMQEWVLREALGKPDVANRLALERAGAAPKGIDNSIELAERLVDVGDVEKAARSLVDGIPSTVKLTTEQSARLTAIVDKIRPETLVRKDPASIAAAIHLLDLIAARGNMSGQMHITRLTLLAVAYPEDTERLVNAVEEMGRAFPEARKPAYGSVIAELLKLSDASAALRFAGAAAHRLTPADPDLFFEWFRLTAVRGDKDDFQAFVDTLTSTDGSAFILTALTENTDEGLNVPEAMQERKAEIMYHLGMLLTADGREPASEDAYRICLSLRPDHAWAANNLGYGLLERGGDVHEAYNLISSAYKQLPDNASIVDSMGWVMYKLGRLEDVRDEHGDVTLGALSLLRQAAGDRPDNAVLLDHYADALWRSGDPERRKEAQELWRQAEDRLRREVSFLRADDPVSARMRERSQAQLNAVKEKRRAVSENREPPVAPLAENIQPKP